MNNRAYGWKHAKLTGHKNEENIDHLLINSKELQHIFLKSIGKEHSSIIEVTVGGKNETDVESILGGMTKSKTDMKVKLDDGTTINVSIKKSLSGQVYLIGIERFIKGYELQYNEIIPANVKEAIRLFWGDSQQIGDIIIKYSDPKFVKYEKRKHRLVAETLKKYDVTLYSALIEWFSNNTVNLFDFCFSRGLAKNKEDRADVVRYKNTLGENDVDVIFDLYSLKSSLRNEANYGIVNGGTTINLPFGFVQWHSPRKVIPGEIQFHHQYKKLEEYITEYFDYLKK